MFAVVRDSRLLHHLENALLCEALARGFADVAALRAWEATLPRDSRGGPVKPPTPARVVELKREHLDQLDNLREQNFTEDEILVTRISENEFHLQGDEHARALRLQGDSWKAIREKRNELLRQSDKYALPDFPLEAGRRELWMSYRQALRDITANANDPHTVRWPSSP